MTDYRFQRTEADIQRAFLAALTEQGFERLSVAELARLSRVDRTTFYAHYDSLYALAEQVITQEVDLLRKAIQEGIQRGADAGDRYQLFSSALIDELSGQAETIQRLRTISLGAQGLDAQCRQLFAAVYHQVLGVSPTSFTGFLLVNMAMSDLDFILINHRAPAREELAASLSQLAEIAKRFK
ncbi:TetR/AcrR family transcriptional regulator [Lacticaseibacillus daqingensis]|uniref:TetR/AcrR family transcriptional regulator n=1 Tax=Lacticaseibacillus daqingensis TaxID=2486014 RepID=UPI000F7B16F0|nr:TetR/AcrR family transcriptional regulator [Lacticaseibacillus daqingensis]